MGEGSLAFPTLTRRREACRRGERFSTTAVCPGFPSAAIFRALVQAARPWNRSPLGRSRGVPCLRGRSGTEGVLPRGGGGGKPSPRWVRARALSPPTVPSLKASRHRLHPRGGAPEGGGWSLEYRSKFPCPSHLNLLARQALGLTSASRCKLAANSLQTHCTRVAFVDRLF